ncbi:hypothetical protein PBY51_014599 [Eleginops maclovinus]|uniref:Uncharacterized protein n=1 Tax=Eleginops maclovinus TaxID=56733 RepID=A0AAN7X3S7_ELEMC|nr:hypothetical protein PBY51_014599 [Eleginops maclovinus]
MAGPEKLPVAMQKGPSLYPGSLAQPHIFVLPLNTTGEAKLKKGSRPLAISQVPPPPQYDRRPFLPIWYHLRLDPHSLRLEAHRCHCHSAVSQALTSGQTNMPYSTQQYRKRKRAIWEG